MPKRDLWYPDIDQFLRIKDGGGQKKIEILFPENYRKVSKILAILVRFKAFWSKFFRVQVWWIESFRQTNQTNGTKINIYHQGVTIRNCSFEVAQMTRKWMFPKIVVPGNHPFQ